MCDPVTAAMAIVGIGGASLDAAGTVIGIQATRNKGKFEKDMSEYQAKLERQRAVNAQKNAEIQAQRLASQRRLETASGMASFAANGMLIDGDPNSAPNIWEQDMAAETAWQQEELRTQAMYEAWGHNANASMIYAQGRMARKGAQLEMAGQSIEGINGFLKSGASIGQSMTMLI